MIAFIYWYVAVQLISVLGFPLAYQFFRYLPDRGYTISKAFGVLLVGFTFWLGFSYGLLRNETGGAWLALLIVGGVAYRVGHHTFRRNADQQREIVLYCRKNVSVILAAECLFLAAFMGWAWVRAHDPAVLHTEQPMDLMMMNGLWASATYPPHDPWLAGYPISYYYFGYWLLITVGRLASQPPEIAYNLGQACWYGLLLLGCFGVMYNLLMLCEQKPRRSVLTPILGGFIAALTVGLAGNLQVIPEWLHAQGVDITTLANWLQVHEFPEFAAVTNQWYIGTDGWWWRSSRIIQDINLFGERMDTSPITEMPIFSYILGDNHPHLLAMPFMLLMILTALNLLLTPMRPIAQSAQQSSLFDWQSGKRLMTQFPLGFLGFLLTVIIVGAPLFLNTWDFPSYWLLFVLVFAFSLYHVGVNKPLYLTVGVAIAVVAGAWLCYLPYFFTAQSQANGLLPNFFYPTALPQFLLIFGHFWIGLGLLIWLAWQETPPRIRDAALVVIVITGTPLLFLIISALLVLQVPMAQQFVPLPELPANGQTYLHMMISRWLAQPWTYLLNGISLALVITLVWSRLSHYPDYRRSPVTFALLLAGIGLLLTYAPEFVYLRDNFGTRMNTIFKFYYQDWLLLGIAALFGLLLSLRQSSGLRLFGLTALVIMMLPLLYPVAGIYSKTNGFGSSTITLNAIAHIANHSPDEMAAIEWIRANTPTDAIVVESPGDSYASTHNRISTMTGRATLMGWVSHQLQWRGNQFSTMSQGRLDALETLYRGGSREEIAAILQQWNIRFVYVGPIERQRYQIGPAVERRLQNSMNLVFEQGNVQIYEKRGR